MNANETLTPSKMNVHVSSCEESNLAVTFSPTTEHSPSTDQSQFLQEPSTQTLGSPPQSGGHVISQQTESSSDGLSFVVQSPDSPVEQEVVDDTKQTVRWFRRPLIMIPLCLAIIILILFAVLMGVLYPRDPSVTASNLHIAALSISYTSNPVLVNATVVLDVDVYNPNYYGSHYLDSQIAYSSDSHEGIQGVVDIPGGYLGSRKHVTQVLSTNLTNVILDLRSIYLWQSDGLVVNAQGETRGWVDVLDIRVDYALKTNCQAKFTLDLASFSATVVSQECSSKR